jgi:hypothetical protein
MKTKNRNIDGDLHFRGFRIKPFNARLAWETVKARTMLIDKVNIVMPAITAYCVDDADFERIHEQRSPESERLAKAIQVAEYGKTHSANPVNAFVRIFRDSVTDEIRQAWIFIRASIYKESKEKIYGCLEHEIKHVLYESTTKPLTTRAIKLLAST